MNQRCTLAAISCALLLISGVAPRVEADDDTLRCGSKLVSPGVSMSYVLAQCGEPTSRAKESVPQHGRRANGSTYVIGTVLVDIWTYDRGSSRFPALLRFEGGKLVKLEFLRE